MTFVRRIFRALANRRARLRIPVARTAVRGAELFHPPDHNLIAAHLAGDVIEGTEYEIMRRWIGEGLRHFVDVGANIGFHALPLAVAGAEKVYAFEANPIVASYLRLGVFSNRMGKAVEVIAAAITDSEGCAEFVSHGQFGSTADGLIDGGRAWSDKRTLVVPSMTLDCWMDVRQPERIDVIKIDVEGAELLVLHGAERLIRRFQPRILMEWWPANFETYGFTGEQLLDWVAAMGYEPTSTDGRKLAAIDAASGHMLPDNEFMLVLRPAGAQT